MYMLVSIFLAGIVMVEEGLTLIRYASFLLLFFSGFVCSPHASTFNLELLLNGYLVYLNEILNLQALSVIRSLGLSVAIFAAGWTHECLDQRNFILLEYLFWQKIWPFLYLHGPNRLPFSTSFCQGYGTNIFKNGAVCIVIFYIYISWNYIILCVVMCK